MRAGLAGLLCGALAGALVTGYASARAAPAQLQVVPLPADAAIGVSMMADDETRNRIIEAVQKRYNASVVKVTEITVEGRRAYELKLLSEQRVWTIRVDAETGRELPRAD